MEVSQTLQTYCMWQVLGCTKTPQDAAKTEADPYTCLPIYLARDAFAASQPETHAIWQLAAIVGIEPHADGRCLAGNGY